MLGFRKQFNLSPKIASKGNNIFAFELAAVFDNPTVYGTSSGDTFGYSADMSNLYTIIGSPAEDNAGGTDSGVAYIYSNSTKTLVQTLINPNAYNTVSNDYFGHRVAISDSYAVVGAYAEDDAGGTDSGAVYVFNPTTGNLLYTFSNPNPYASSSYDYFGYSLAVNDSYAVVGAFGEGDSGGTVSGKAYIYDLSTGSLLYTLTNPTSYGTSSGDHFGESVSISETYAIIGAPYEGAADGSNSGAAYIYDLSTGSLLYTLTNPNSYGTSSGDYFGYSVALTDSYAAVSAYNQSDSSGIGSGTVYVFNPSTGSLITTINNPSAYSTGTGDAFGMSISISPSYLLISAYSEDEVNNSASGIAYVYSTSTWGLLYTLPNPNAYGTSYQDQFGSRPFAITDSYAVITTIDEADAGGAQAGKAYFYSRSPADRIYIASTGLVEVLPNVSSLTTTITIPTQVLAGDLLVLADTSTTVTNTIPSGFTSITEATTTGIRTNVSYKIAISTDAGTSITGMAGTTRKSLRVFRRVGGTISNISISTPAAQATTAAPTNQTISPGTKPSIYFAVYAKTAVTTITRGFSNSTKSVESSSVSTSGIYVKAAIYDTGTNTITAPTVGVSMTDGGTNTLQSFRLDIS